MHDIRQYVSNWRLPLTLISQFAPGLTPSTLLDYPLLSTDKAVVGFDILDDRGDEPQALRLAAFLLPGLPLMGGLGGELQGSPVRSRYVNPSMFRPPRLTSWQAVLTTNRRSHIMTNTPLVPVFTGTISNQSIQLCNARDLHHSLESQQEFANWIKNRIKQYGFIQNEDYLTNLSNRSDGMAGKRRTEYHLTLDMAQELGMVENNEKGRQIRRHFISLKRAATKPQPEIRYFVGQDGSTKLAIEAAELIKLNKQLLKSLSPTKLATINPPV